MAITRAAFFREFNHVDADHQELTAFPLDEDKAALVRGGCLGNDPPWEGALPNRCGWWWCRLPTHPKVRWRDLTDALRLLRDHSVDPRSLPVAKLAQLFLSEPGWEQARQDFAKLEAALKRPKLGPNGAALRSKYLEDLRAHARVAGAAPRRGPGAPSKVNQGQVIAAAAGLGWNASLVAAVMLLTGVERDAFTNAKGRWNKAWHRWTKGKDQPATGSIVRGSARKLASA